MNTPHGTEGDNGKWKNKRSGIFKSPGREPVVGSRKTSDTWKTGCEGNKRAHPPSKKAVNLRTSNADGPSKKIRGIDQD